MADVVGLFLDAHHVAGVLVMFFPGRWINPSLFQVGFVSTEQHLGGGVRMPPLQTTARRGFDSAGGHGWMGTAATGNRQHPEPMGHLDGVLDGWEPDGVLPAMQVSVSGTSAAFLDTLLTFAFLLSLVSVVQYFSSEGKIFWFYPTYEAAVLDPSSAATGTRFLWRCFCHWQSCEPWGAGVAAVCGDGSGDVCVGDRRASRAGALLTTAEIIVVPLMAWKKGSFLQDRIGAATARIWLFALVFTAVVVGRAMARFQDRTP